ncbi:thioredoxin [Blastococcus sp. SYSU DS0533]
MGTDPARPALTTCPGCGRRNRLPGSARGRPRCPACHADLPWLVDAGDADFDDVVKKSRIPVLVDVWAPWCGPCRAVAPVVEQLARDRAGRLKVAKVNADTAPGASTRLQVSGIPTLVLVAHGRERARLVGAQPATTIHRWLDQHLGAEAQDVR